MMKISDMFDLNVCKNLYLAAGKKGLKNNIRWFYIVKDIDGILLNIKEGDMLIFDTSFDWSGSSMRELLKTAAAKNVSGILAFGETIRDYVNFSEFDLSSGERIPFLILQDTSIPVTDLTYHLAMGIFHENNLQYDLKNFMRELLEGNFGNRTTLYSRAEYFHYNLNQPHRVLIFRLCNFIYGDAESEKKIRKLQYLGDLFFQNYYNLYLTGILQGDYIALLPEGLPGHPLEKLADKFNQKLHTQEENMDCYIAIGNTYENPEHFWHSREDAEHILKICAFLGRKNSVENTFGLIEYLGILNIHDQNIIEAAYELMARLEENGEENKTRLIEALETYLSCNGNVMLAAQKLYLHRNTMKMRVDKIESICEVNLRSYRDCFRMQTALTIYRLREAGIL